MLIYLIGLPGVGKSTLGKQLAKKLSYQFIDLDNQIEETLSLSISTIFTEKGENYFREVESLELEKTFKKENCIISTGGGTPCFNNNIEKINAKGVSIYLKVEPEDIYDRLSNSELKKRPLFKDQNSLLKLQQLLSKREIYYNKASFTTDAFNEGLVEEIIFFSSSEKDY